MKENKTICTLLALGLTSVLLASCSLSSPTKTSNTNTQSDTTAFSVESSTDSEKASTSIHVSDSTSAIQPIQATTQAFPEGTVLEPNQEDLICLEGIINWTYFFDKDYDSETSPILDYLWDGISMGMEQYDLLIVDENYGHQNSMGDDDSSDLGSDPRHCFDGGCYRKIRKDVMEYYLENVFHNTSYLSNREMYTVYGDPDEKFCLYYYEDGWYYFCCEHKGKEEFPKVREYQKDKNGHYLLTIDKISYFNNSEPLATIQMDATLTQKDGRRLWTIYSSKVTLHHSY